MRLPENESNPPVVQENIPSSKNDEGKNMESMSKSITNPSPEPPIVIEKAPLSPKVASQVSTLHCRSTEQPLQNPAPPIADIPKIESAHVMYVECPENPNEDPRLINFTHSAQIIKCPYCWYRGESSVYYRAGCRTYFFMGLLLFLLPPALCVPLCVSKCKYAMHRCPACSKKFGIHTPCS